MLRAGRSGGDDAGLVTMQGWRHQDTLHFPLSLSSSVRRVARVVVVERARRLAPREVERGTSFIVALSDGWNSRKNSPRMQMIEARAELKSS